MTDYTELDAKIAALGLDYTATFVPFSKSRNAKPGPKINELSVNWKVLLEKGGASLETDYMQGIGHLPKPLNSGKMSRTVDEANAIHHACEHGKYPRHRGIFAGSPLPTPGLRDVLYSLMSDSGALDSPTFEDWASNYGYDVDSRKAEQIYRACLETALKLRAMIGEPGLSALREAFRDY